MKVPFDKVLFNLTRLDIVSNLEDTPEPIPFTELRDVMEVTDGNLSSHLTVLRKHNIIKIHKGFRDRKPHTTISLTSKGQTEFEKLKNWLYQCFIEGG